MRPASRVACLLRVIEVRGDGDDGLSKWFRRVRLRRSFSIAGE